MQSCEIFIRQKSWIELMGKKEKKGKKLYTYVFLKLSAQLLLDNLFFEIFKNNLINLKLV